MFEHSLYLNKYRIAFETLKWVKFLYLGTVGFC